ncbi:tripartite tricarboxylate transporter family receptor [Bordetella bronchiseptica MBORD635]|nr:tripartite tricarboxylate transporter family receptor [Bordetella bronchiseptica 00-P-2730]KCV51842.1 tripartite tricarboxylate transporter family receptor [Bordetella bronchiseptica 3E44]KDC59195.1 tripartite tricarboxylate transporter family receptor [Bordetella bronchiseptica MBORD595]KDC75671.1 tripartite tricarboxylate transporter family receptor [Bordetella bronchiseptica MBORD635]KDD50072.1 tripartite tricarboxylate transporter family receptor [Bordetella bronchiseptica OSU553]KDD527
MSSEMTNARLNVPQALSIMRSSPCACDDTIVLPHQRGRKLPCAFVDYTSTHGHNCSSGFTRTGQDDRLPYPRYRAATAKRRRFMSRKKSPRGGFRSRLRRAGGTLASIIVATACTLPVTSPARAEYPNRPVTLVVPYSPGGGVDAVARVFARSLSDKFKQSVVVENRPGAGAMIGIDYANRARPDGYTLLIVDPAFVINPSLQPQVSYKVSDLKPVGILTGSPLVLVSAKNSRFDSLAGMLKISKVEGKGVTYATPGIGTTPHMAGELLRETQGANLTQVPYKGSGPATADVISGQVDVGFMSITAAATFLKENRLQGLATSGTARSTVLPDLPTIAEVTQSDYSVLFWTGLFISAKVPDEIQQSLAAAVQAVYADPAYAKGLAGLGETPVGTKLADPGQYVNAEYSKWAALIAKANLKQKD